MVYVRLSDFSGNPSILAPPYNIPWEIVSESALTFADKNEVTEPRIILANSYVKNHMRKFLPIIFSAMICDLAAFALAQKAICARAP